MARKTTEELEKALQTLQKNYEETVQVQKNIQERAIAVNAMLQDRKEAELEKKSSAK